MRFTRKQKSLSVVLGLGLLALTVDRLFLNSSTDTAAGASAATDASVGPAPSLSATLSGMPTLLESGQSVNGVLAQRLATQLGQPK